jgi:cobalt-zinc-cadmium efflux system outer membrane protein
MNLVLSALGVVCRKNIRPDRGPGKIFDMVRRFGFTSPVIAFLLVGAANPIAAQSQQSGAVTVSQAVQEAVEKNLNLLAERYNVSIAEAKIVTARIRPNPVLTLYGDLLPLGRGSTDQNPTGPPEYGIRTEWTIERGGKRNRRIDVAENARRVTQWRLLNATRTLALDVRNAFVDTLLAKENLALAQENLKSFNQIMEVNKVRVTAGDLAAVELRRTQLADLQLRNAALQAQMKLRLAKERLQLLMGRAVPAVDFDVIDAPRRDPPPASMGEVERLALDLRPDLQALRCDRERSEAEIRLQTAQGKVDYTVAAEYRRQQGLQGRGDSVGFFISVPLPVFDRNRGEIERAVLELGQLDARIAAMEAEIRNEAHNAWRQYETARVLLADIENDMLKQSRQVLDTMEFSYRRGDASFVDFIEAQRACNGTMQSYNEARAEYARSLYLIDSTIGKAPR